MARKRRRRARDLNENLGRAYDLLRRAQIPFYNDKRTHGRSLKPIVPVGPRLHGLLRKLADDTRVTPAVRSQHGNGHAGGEIRYWFSLPR